MEIYGCSSPPGSGIRVIRKRSYTGSFNGEFLHLRAFTLEISSKRADEMDQMPGIVSICPVAHRHRAPGNSRHDMTVERCRIGTALENADRQITRPGRVALGIDLLLRAVASCRSAV